MIATTSKVEDAINHANGKRRTRTLCAERAKLAALRVTMGKVDCVYQNAGHVANAYSYPAVTTVFLVRRCDDGVVRFVATAANAKKGSTGVGDMLRGDKITASLAGTPVTAAEIVNEVTEADFLPDTSVEVLHDWLEENGIDY